MKNLSRSSGVATLAIVLASLLWSMSSSKLIAQTGVMEVPAEETHARAIELWEKAVAAKGGRERLRHIISLYVAVDQGQGYRQSVFYNFPNFIFSFSYDPDRESSALQVSNAKRKIVWWQVQGNPAKTIKYDEEDIYLNLLPQFTYLLVTNDLDPMPLRVRKERLGLKWVDVVQTDAKGWPVDYYLDSETHLPVKVVLPLGPRARAKREMNHIVTLKDYVAVDGVMMPQTAIHSYTFNSQNLRDRLSFEINPLYDSQIFEQPPTPRMGSEAWRAKRPKT